MDALKLTPVTALLAPATLWIAYSLLNLVLNIDSARKTGLPWKVVPTLESHFLGNFFGPYLRRLYSERLLKGESWPRWLRFSVPDWAWEDKGRAHKELGDIFLVVSPAGIICYSSDAEMGWNVMNRRVEFIKPPDRMKQVEPYGPNVATTEGKVFQFHLRMTAPAVSEGSGINDAVWSETVSLTRRMMGLWHQSDAQDFLPDMKRLTLSVISNTAFGTKLDIEDEEAVDRPAFSRGLEISLERSLYLVTEFLVSILLIPKWVMRFIGMQEIAAAHKQLKTYMREMVQEETAKLEKDNEYLNQQKGNLLKSVVRASLQEAEGTGRKQAFTDDELLGNMFIWLMAGYETTAHALVYGVVNLALDQDVQAQLQVEIDRVNKEAASEGRQTLTFANDFGKLEHTYGFMYEILRLYPALSQITKMVTDKPTAIKAFVGDDQSRDYLLPADCRVYLNSVAVHYNDRYWPEAREIKPERWRDPLSLRHGGERYERKTVANDGARQVKGMLQTFSGGGRACLGRKFAQAEFVATIVTILSEYRIELSEGLDPVAVKNEIDWLSAGKFTLSPQRPVKLVLKKRNEPSLI